MYSKEDCCDKCGTPLVLGPRCFNASCFYPSLLSPPSAAAACAIDERLETRASFDLQEPPYQRVDPRGRAHSVPAPLRNNSHPSAIRSRTPLPFSAEREQGIQALACRYCGGHTSGYKGSCQRCNAALCGPCCFSFVQDDEEPSCRGCLRSYGQ
jgi:hypothetical protein